MSAAAPYGLAAGDKPGEGCVYEIICTVDRDDGSGKLVVEGESSCH